MYAGSQSVGRALRWLRQFFVGRMSHVPSKLNQDSLHCILSLPLCKARKLGGVNLSIPGVDARQVDLVNELDGGWLVRIFFPTVHFQRIDAILVDTVGRTKDCTIPVRHQQIITFSKTIRACLSSQTLLSLLQLLQQSKIPWNLCTHRVCLVGLNLRVCEFQIYLWRRTLTSL